MKNKLILVVTIAFFLVFSVWNLIGEKAVYSESERRRLEKFPELSMESLINGEFSEGLETYAADHFPLRDYWRGVKAFAKTTVLRQKDNNGLYSVGNHLGKIEYPMNISMLEYANDRFENISIPEETKVYFAIVPDKNRYLAQEKNHLSLDYEALTTHMIEAMPWAKYIEVADLLELDDYYYTDTHWRQERIVDVAERLVKSMDSAGKSKSWDYTMVDPDISFFGVLAGQAARNVTPDKMYYLTNETIDAMTVEGANAVYDMEKALGRDAYEMYLSGNQPVITIKNPTIHNGKRLIMFRDSFGSAIAPILAQEYSETILVDLRYVPSEQAKELVEYHNADVLFLYSTLLLNNSLAIK